MPVTLDLQTKTQRHRDLLDELLERTEDDGNPKPGCYERVLQLQQELHELCTPPGTVITTTTPVTVTASDKATATANVTVNVNPTPPKPGNGSS